MKRLLRFIVLPALVLLVPVFAAPDHISGPPFRMRIVDARTRQGVPGVTVTSDNGLVCSSNVLGDVRWTETSVVGRKVRFRLRDPETASEKAMVQATSGGYQEIVLQP